MGPKSFLKACKSLGIKAFPLKIEDSRIFFVESPILKPKSFLKAFWPMEDLAKTCPGIFNLQWESFSLKAFKSCLNAFGPIEDLAKTFPAIFNLQWESFCVKACLKSLKAF